MKNQFYHNTENLTVGQNQNYLSLVSFKHPQVQRPIYSEFHHEPKSIPLKKNVHSQEKGIVKKINFLLWNEKSGFCNYLLKYNIVTLNLRWEIL